MLWSKKLKDKEMMLGKLGVEFAYVEGIQGLFREFE